MAQLPGCFQSSMPCGGQRGMYGMCGMHGMCAMYGMCEMYGMCVLVGGGGGLYILLAVSVPVGVLVWLRAVYPSQRTPR